MNEIMKWLKKNPYWALAFITVALFFVPFIAALGGNAWVRIIDSALLYVILALGLNIVVGYAGLLDLGYIAFYAVGAYVTGLLASPQMAVVMASFADQYPMIGDFLVTVLGAQVAQDGLHLSIWVIIPLGALFAALAGAVLGAPTLKLRGDYLAIVTLGFGEIVRIFTNNLNAPVNITNGPQGIDRIDGVHLFGVDFAGVGNEVSVFGMTLHPTQVYYYLFLFLTIITIILCLRLQNSRLGRAWMAIREDEVAAKSMGINTRNVKLLAFAMGASFGGVSGALFASFQQFISPESFVLPESIVILAMVVLGGMGHVPGVVLGALLLASLPLVLLYVPTVDLGFIQIDRVVVREMVFALAMIFTMLYRPYGLWPAPKHGIKSSDAEKGDTK